MPVTIVPILRVAFAYAAIAILPGLLLVACKEKSPAAPDPPSRTGQTLDILRSDGGGVSFQGRNVPFADVGADFDVRGTSAGGFPGRLFAESAVSFGVNERATAASFVYSDWSSQAGDYRVAADVTWSGRLAGNGIAGTGARVAFTLEVRDFMGRLLASQLLHERELRESGLTIGGLVVQGSTSAAVDFTLPPNTGGPFRIMFKLTCEASSGLVGTTAFCLFGRTPAIVALGGSGYAEWTRLSVTEFR